jgi:Flp pilus assembly protein TadD
MWLELRRFEEAEKSLRAALALDANDARSHLSLAAALRGRGLTDEALRHEALGRRLAGSP